MSVIALSVSCFSFARFGNAAFGLSSDTRAYLTLVLMSGIIPQQLWLRQSLQLEQDNTLTDVS